MTQLAEKTEKIEPKSAQIKDAAFKWDDPLDLEGELTEEERMVRDTARDYAQEKLFPRVLAANRDGHYDPAIQREMGALGLLDATIPPRYGGAGLGYVSYGLMARELGARRFRIPHGDVRAIHPRDAPDLRLYGSEAQRRKYLPRLATAERLGCFGLTEPDPGSDPGRCSRGPNHCPRLPPDRQQDLDHQLAGRRRGGGAGEADGTTPRRFWSSATRWDLDAENRRQAVAARLDHRRDRARRRRSCPRRISCRRFGLGGC